METISWIVTSESTQRHTTADDVIYNNILILTESLFRKHKLVNCVLDQALGRRLGARYFILFHSMCQLQMKLPTWRIGFLGHYLLQKVHLSFIFSVKRSSDFHSWTYIQGKLHFNHLRLEMFGVTTEINQHIYYFLFIILMKFGNAPQLCCWQRWHHSFWLQINVLTG